MTPRERVLAVLHGELPDVIPSYREIPMDVTVWRDLMPKKTGDAYQDAVNHARFFDNSTLGSVIEMRKEILEEDESHSLYRYETGAIWREIYKPTFCREAVSYPINKPEDVESFKMPDPEAPLRVKGFAENVKRWHDDGYFVHGIVLGPWAGIYYYLTSFNNILTWMAAEPEVAEKIFEKMGDFAYRSARIHLEMGVDAIYTSSDLGSGSSLLFSLKMLDHYVLPMLESLAALCHSYGAVFKLHSHGHIGDIMDRIVAAGVDIIDPVGPSDNNDLRFFKEKWGRRIVLDGGISTTVAQMSNPEIEAHIAHVMEIGCRGGRFMPSLESGMPNIPVEKARFYMDTLARYRRKYGAAS